MAEYINKEVAIRKTEVFCDVFDTKWTDEKVLAWIGNLPAVDAVPVVRCRDCKHNVENWNHDELDVTDYTDITCDFFMTDGMQPDDFCSCGERKDGDGNG